MVVSDSTSLGLVPYRVGEISCSIVVCAEVAASNDYKMRSMTQLSLLTGKPHFLLLSLQVSHSSFPTSSPAENAGVSAKFGSSSVGRLSMQKDIEKSKRD